MLPTWRSWCSCSSACSGASRPPDDTHPLGYGRERFFWSLFAALGIFLGGGVLGLDEAIRSAVHPSAVHAYPVAYLVLAVTIALDAFALLEIALRPLRERAAGRGISLRRATWAGAADPVPTTVVVGTGLRRDRRRAATAGLVLNQVTGNPAPDAVASALIGLLLVIASVVLLRTNRDLLSGRGVQPSMFSAKCPGSSPRRQGWSMSRTCSPSWSARRA